MSKNDWNYTCAAATYGAVAALMPTPIPNEAEEGSPEAQAAVQMPSSWGELKESIQKEILSAVGFLSAYTGTADPASLDRDTAGMALAKFCKETEFAAFKPNYAVFLSVFISTRQAYGL